MGQVDRLGGFANAQKSREAELRSCAISSSIFLIKIGLPRARLDRHSVSSSSRTGQSYYFLFKTDRRDVTIANGHCAFCGAIEEDCSFDRIGSHCYRYSETESADRKTDEEG